ncbi:MAG: amylo-alpha-1,6-glucosidase [archaeon]
MDGILVKHVLKGLKCEGYGKPKFLLTSNGAYFYNNQNSKYRGLFSPIDKGNNTWSMFKSLDNISICAEIKSVTNKFGSYLIETEKGNLEFSFENQVLRIVGDFEGDIIFTLDMREIFDYDDKGRYYEIYEENKLKIVEYKKFQDTELTNMMYDEFLVFKTKFPIEKIGAWRSEHYSEDEQRKSYPQDLYVFDAFKVKWSKKGVMEIAFDDDKGVAIKKVEKYQSVKFEGQKINAEKEKLIAYNCAIKSIFDLQIEMYNSKGFYAGLPWFFQIWTRDEGISMKALVDLGKYDLVKAILQKRISLISTAGRIQNRWPPANLETADGTGWVFMRLHELLQAIKENKAMEQYFSSNDLHYMYGQLKNSIEAQWKNTKNFLVINKALETWMDTSNEGDTREGARIEIQALWLAQLKFSSFLADELSMKREYEYIEKETKKKVKEIFFTGEILKDGSEDTTIRPNVFMAKYIYPDLLTNEEWEKVFDACINSLWLDWGGFSTIDKNSKLYCSHYSGEDNKSYHRGDSWFFINNIAAMSLHMVNPEKYKPIVDKIIEASTKDILYNGIIARPSELSSAAALKAEASLYQLWSAATYVELIKNVT